MSKRAQRIGPAAPGLFLTALVMLFTNGENHFARGFVDRQLPTLRDLCDEAEEVTILKVEKIDREKQAIVYTKARDLKGVFPAKQLQGTLTIVLRSRSNSTLSPADKANMDQLNEAVLALSAEGQSAVIFHKRGLASVCVGQAWYTILFDHPGEHLPQRGAADSRYARAYCGDVQELIATIPDVMAGKEVMVPRMVGSNRMLNDRTAPIRRKRADRIDIPDGFDYQSPLQGQAPWSTHRGNPQRTGADDVPGPTKPNVLWVYPSKDHFIAPLVPGEKHLYASSLGSFNTAELHAFALDPDGDKQGQWSKGAPLLSRPIAGAPALLKGHPQMQVLVFGDGFHTDEGASLRCVRAADGLPLWQLTIPGELVHFEGTPTFTSGGHSDAHNRLYVGGGNAGVLCLAPGVVLFEGREYDLMHWQGVLAQRWKELLAKYEVDVKKDPMFTVRPDESMLPQPPPKRFWQQGDGKWHVDPPVAVVEDRVLAASAYLDDEKTGERALVCLKARDGEIVWKAPLKLNPWAGPTVGPYVLVGCSSIRLDPKGVDQAMGEVVAVELDTGKVRWRRDVPGGVLSAIAVRAGLAIFTATDGKVRAWDAFTGAERWSYDATAPFFAGPAVARNTVYAADLKGIVHALNITDGKREWGLDLGADPATKAPGMVYGSPILHRGRLYLATCNLGDGAGRTANVVVCIGDK
jgi:outer membrane protein assembly factor BamB